MNTTLTQHQGGDLFAFDFYVDGVTCSRCVQKLNGLQLPWIEKTSFDFSNSLLKIYSNDPNPPIGQVQNSIRRLGFNSRLMADKDQVAIEKRNEQRRSLAQIAVAAFCAGNIMLMTLGIYGGSDVEWTLRFGWLSFTLFLPILFFSAQPFYISALRSIKQWQAGVDVPIVVALWLGFLLSAWNLAIGRTEFYFDSTATFLLLILSSRFLLNKYQNYFFAINDLRSRLSQGFVRKLENGSIKNVSADQVTRGDHLEFHRGELIPQDGILESETAQFDLSFFSGESLPKTILRSETVWAGSRLISPSCEIQCTSDLKSSRIGQIMSQCQEAWAKRSEQSLQVERWSHWLVGSTMAIALGLFFYWLRIDFYEAVNRPLALLIVACPCAMAFAIPVSYLAGLRKAFDRGLLIRDASTLERVLEVDRVLLDKTGTLTENNLELNTWYPRNPTVEEQKIMWLLENGNDHPIADAIRRAVSPIGIEDVKIERFHEGTEGVKANINGIQYELKRTPVGFLPDFLNEAPSSTLFENGRPVLTALFSETIKSGSAELISWLQNQGLKVEVLSGDNLPSVRALTSSLGLVSTQAHGALSPEQKALMASHGASLFFGDGINDSLALARARVGVAAKGSIEGLIQTSDAFVTTGNPLLLRDLILISRFCKKLVRRNLTLSLIYNLIAGGLAVAGLVNPLIAALLMPLNSVITISSSVWSWKNLELD